MKTPHDDSKKRFKLVHSNLYQIQPKSEKPTPAQKPLPKSSAVLKTGDYNTPSPKTIRVNPYTANALQGKKTSTPPAPILAENLPPHLALKSLKQNLKTLNDMQARMRMLLKELEELG